MPRGRSRPRLGLPVGDKYLLRQTCRHGRSHTDQIELGYPIVGNVCTGCLADLPAVALLNTAQARQLRERLRAGAICVVAESQHGPVIGPALNALAHAEDLCISVRRERRMSLRGKKADLLVVCTCLEARLVDIGFDFVIRGELCDGCGRRLPSMHWLPEDRAAAFVDELRTVSGQRRALQAAKGEAPIADYPVE